MTTHKKRAQRIQNVQKELERLLDTIQDTYNVKRITALDYMKIAVACL